ncbi:MAG: ATP-binding protein [Kiritimatiellae bacterium]|nr:ATP-binding protein [Kiritimatiellia bacterium]
MKEIVVISGKGGTGKTSVTAALAALARQSVLVDCDVDAADLHLLLQPEIRRRQEFCCGHQAVVRSADCVGCGACQAQCRFDAIRPSEDAMTFRVDTVGCEGCGVCVRVCPVKAIDFPERSAGEWYVSDTRHGPMVHARLNPGGENSGKLVALVREEARKLAEAKGLNLILLDGPPGIGCPVIASITGASQVLVVTEPTLSGLHDLERVLGLTRHFRIPAAVCVNKWDINPAQTELIERRAIEQGAKVAGRIRYDRAVTGAQVQGCSIVESTPNATAADLKVLWEILCSETAN